MMDEVLKECLTHGEHELSVELLTISTFLILLFQQISSGYLLILRIFKNLWQWMSNNQEQ